MMRVSTKTLEKKPVGSEERFAFDRPEIEDVGQDVSVQGSVTRLNAGYHVQMDATWHQQVSCDRCLKEFDLQFAQELDDVVGDPEEPSDTLEVDGHSIDLTPLLHEASVLAWPAKVLCKASCRGLCDQCGQDLNDGPCACPPPEGDPRLSVLKNLQWEDE